jgi:hypothetical protein
MCDRSNREQNKCWSVSHGRPRGLESPAHRATGSVRHRTPSFQTRGPTEGGLSADLIGFRLCEMLDLIAISHEADASEA